MIWYYFEVIFVIFIAGESKKNLLFLLQIFVCLSVGFLGKLALLLFSFLLIDFREDFSELLKIN